MGRNERRGNEKGGGAVQEGRVMVSSEGGKDNDAGRWKERRMTMTRKRRKR